MDLIKIETIDEFRPYKHNNELITYKKYYDMMTRINDNIIKNRPKQNIKIKTNKKNEIEIKKIKIAEDKEIEIITLILTNLDD
jgi:hypothetical protein